MCIISKVLLEGGRKMASPSVNFVSIFTISACCIDLNEYNNRYTKLLEPQELIKAARFRFDSDKLRYLIARAMARLVLSQYAGVAPENLRFTKNDYGRPEIANSSYCKEKVRFNISYSKDIIVLAVAMNVDIGVDIEFVYENADFFLYTKGILSETELRYLTNMPSEARSLEFFKIWTLKEAYIKSRGLGLAIGLEKLSFLLSSEKISLCVEEDIDKNADSWGFFNLEIIPSYIISICVKKLVNRSSKILLISMTSLEDMMNFAGPMVKSSG